MKLFLVFIFTIGLAMADHKATLSVPGMECQMCVQGMKKHFKDVVKNPRKDIQVNLEEDLVELRFSKKVSEKEIRERVQRTGYNVSKIEWKKHK